MAASVAMIAIVRMRLSSPCDVELGEKLDARDDCMVQ